MTYKYIITPLISWIVSGSIKFLINSILSKRLAFDLIGYGGLPSTHTTIVTAMTFLIAIDNGLHDSSFGVALVISIIVILDASSLRRQVGRHARVLNNLLEDKSIEKFYLRERIGHRPIEIFSGILVGCTVGFMMSNYFLKIVKQFFL